MPDELAEMFTDKFLSRKQYIALSSQLAGPYIQFEFKRNALDKSRNQTFCTSLITNNLHKLQVAKTFFM
jgi:hypothetical protein